MNNNTSDWTKKQYKVTLSGRLANTIVKALLNESMDDDGTYTKAYREFCVKLDKQGFWDSPSGSTEKE